MKRFRARTLDAAASPDSQDEGVRVVANHYRLSGHGIELEYWIGGNDLRPALVLTDNGIVRRYAPSEISVDQTELGTMVSVPLVGPTDAVHSRFGFFLPAVKVAAGQRAAVTTSGVIQSNGGFCGTMQRPPTWSCVHLHGIAARAVVTVPEAVAA